MSTYNVLYNNTRYIGKTKEELVDAIGQDAAEEVMLEHDYSILRKERDRRLTACDWTQTGDSPLADADKQLWADYRQALRDLPSQTSDPENPTWPEMPA